MKGIKVEVEDEAVAFVKSISRVAAVFAAAVVAICVVLYIGWEISGLIYTVNQALGWISFFGFVAFVLAFVGILVMEIM